MSTTKLKPSKRERAKTDVMTIARVAAADNRLLTILDRIGEGVSMAQACEEAGVARKNFLAYAKEDPTVRELYSFALDMRAERFADEINEIADSATPETAAVAKLRVDARKWVVSKLLPKKYGDKLELSGDKNSPIALQIQFLPCDQDL